MKKETYLTQPSVKVPQFEVGGEYKDDQGNDYRVLSIVGDTMEAKFNFVKKKFKIVKFGSVMGAFNSGRIWFKSAKPNPSLLEQDDSCNIIPRGTYNSLKRMSDAEKREYRRNRAKERRKARREAKKSINKNEEA